MGIVAAKEFPVDFIEGLGLQDCAGHNAASFGGLHDDFQAAEEHVEVRLDHGRVAGALNGEGRAILLVPVDLALVLLFPDLVVGGNALGDEVEGGVAAERLHRGTSRGVEREAVGVGLRQRCGEQHGERGDGGKREGLHCE
jgi:hypothetical protein